MSKPIKRQIPVTKNSGTRLVYSTDPDPEPAPKAAPIYPPTRAQTARIALDRKRRKGKTVTVISALTHDEATFESLLRTLKQRLGTGGTFKDGEIELQGDHRTVVATELQTLGYKVKLI